MLSRRGRTVRFRILNCSLKCCTLLVGSDRDNAVVVEDAICSTLRNEHTNKFVLQLITKSAVPQYELDQVEQFAKLRLENKGAKLLFELIRMLREPYEWPSKEKNVHVHGNPPPCFPEDIVVAAKEGFTVEKTDVVTKQTAHLRGRFAQS